MSRKTLSVCLCVAMSEGLEACGFPVVLRPWWQFPTQLFYCVLLVHETCVVAVVPRLSFFISCLCAHHFSFFSSSSKLDFSYSYFIL